MSDSEVIKEFLVAVGVKVDANSLNKFGGIIGDIGRRVLTFATVLTGAATAVEVFVTKVSEKMEDLYWTSQRLGSSVGAIQDYALGIQNLGGTAEGARSSLEGVMRLLRTSPGYGGLLASLGVNPRAGGVGIMQQLGARFQHMPYFIAAQYAASLGIDEGTLWAMTHAPSGGVHGPGSNAFSSIYRAIGMNPDKAAKAAHDFMVQLRDVEAQFTVLAEVIAYKLTPVARVFTQWVANSLSSVTQAFASVDPKLWSELAASVGALGTAFSALLPTLRDTVSFLSGATRVLADALTVTKDVLAGDFKKASSDAQPIVQRAQDVVQGIGENIDRWVQKAFPASDAATAQKEAMDYFTSKGWSREQAAGIVANLQWESGMDFRKSGDSGKAYGYGQWHGDRAARFQQQFGHDLQDATPYEQLQFVQWELLNSELAAGRALRRTRTARDAAGVVNSLYERPLHPADSARQRADIASRLAGGSAATINQKTDIHVNGSGAVGIARDIVREQVRVNGDLVRNMKMVLQ